jgi:hypothetical protein
MARTVVIAVTDLMFQPRIADAARALGLDVRTPATDDGVHAEVEARPALLVVDLHDTTFGALQLVHNAAAAGVRVLAFGRHTDAAALRAARDAGATSVVPRSQLVEELPGLLARLTDTTAPSP